MAAFFRRRLWRRSRRWLAPSKTAGFAELSGASSLTFSTAGDLTGSAALSGTTTLTFSPTADLVGDVTLSGTSSGLFTTAAALIASGDLSGTSSLTFTATGNLVGFGALSGATTLTFTAAGGLTAELPGDLSGASSLTFTATGNLTGFVDLSGSTSLTFLPSGALQGGDAGYTPPAIPYGDAPPRRSVPWRDKVSPELDRRLSEALERLERVSSEPPRKRRGKFARKRRKPEDLAPIPEGAPQEWLERAYEVLLEARQPVSGQVATQRGQVATDEVAEARRQKMVAELAAYYQAALREAQLEAERQYQLLLDEEAAILVVMMAA